jgi:hypothetical protein
MSIVIYSLSRWGMFENVPYLNSFSSLLCKYLKRNNVSEVLVIDTGV